MEQYEHTTYRLHVPGKPGILVQDILFEVGNASLRRGSTSTEVQEC